ncbi:thymidine kinase [Saprolegnia diclina VS20]|uniref:Thymidine kinase n=1 Tax=Saprolegnia diclina (strain VS20) TaxID=1156394 RepID=T0Q333_SAPDV|nr:thymidine kinase [Saprolegnia diclina VS20]EQC27820.1 thymidine kinase [Saprolegnia diclina VS20]|eukprot:XP_008618750.1 thymidine kinase [Saprolegnia diclina VS20]
MSPSCVGLPSCSAKMPTRSLRRHAPQGELQLIIGPMFSGKTTELIRRMRRFHHAQLKCLVVRAVIDERYTKDDLVSTHDKQMIPATPVRRLAEVNDVFRQYDVIGIDEGHFYPDLDAFCDMAADEGKIVIVAALDGTFERKPFPQVCGLVPQAESVTKLSAVCAVCGTDAAFTRRLVNSTAIELVGGSEMYQPVCRACFTLPQKAEDGAESS